MRALVQRVSQARVEVDGDQVGAIGTGLLVLLGVTHADTAEDSRWLADKVALYRQFCADLAACDLPVATGRFQAHMEVSLTNDGPVTLLVESPVRSAKGE